MKFNKQCPICLQNFEGNDDIKIDHNIFYHVQCFNKREEEKEYELKEELKQVIYNFDEMVEYIEFAIDLEELIAHAQDIIENKYCIIIRRECGDLTIQYSSDDNLEDFSEYLEDCSLDGRECYVVAVIKERKFVKWEEVPRSIKIIGE